MYRVADAQPFRERLAHAADDEGVGLAEARERAGLRAHVTELDGPPGLLSPSRGRQDASKAAGRARGGRDPEKLTPGERLSR